MLRPILVLVALTLPLGIGAQAVDTTVKVTLGGFVDTYYAWDFGRPTSLDRSFAGGTPFTTQPARHNEFNVNLAYVELKADGASIRGRLALQAGTSVQSNYAGEPQNGSVSGPTLARHIQEAFAGVKVGDDVWVDAGVFYSHMGLESWASRDNLTYSRSLVADYSPYYSTGVRATWQPTPKLAVRADVVNGWQNISENNSGKGAGFRLDYSPVPSATLSYYAFATDEAGNKLRLFNGAGAKVAAGKVTWLAQFDAGSQSKSSSGGRTATWYGFTAVGRLELSATAAISARVECFDDADQVILGTGTVDGRPIAALQANGASIGFDRTVQGRVLWRTEVRGFENKAAVFPNGVNGSPSRQSVFIVSSLAISF